MNILIGYVFMSFQDFDISVRPGFSASYPMLQIL